MSNRENENPSDPKNAARASGGATPMSVSLHTYQITSKPNACTDYAVGDPIEIYVTDPPLPTITISNGDDCDGTTATLIS